jgi:hypothetical protein
VDFKSSLGRGRLGARARAPQHRAVSRVSFCWCSGRSECVPPRGKGSVCQWYAAGRCCHRPSLRERLPAGVLWQSGPAVALPEIDHLTMPRVGVIGPVVISLLCKGSAKACRGVTGRVTCRKTPVLFGVSTGRRMDLSPSFMWHLCDWCSQSG